MKYFEHLNQFFEKTNLIILHKQLVNQSSYNFDRVFIGVKVLQVVILATNNKVG